jgi:hypothetical protein
VGHRRTCSSRDISIQGPFLRTPQIVQLPQGFFNMDQEYTFSLVAFRIHQVNEAVSCLEAVETDACPGGEGIAHT